MKPSLNTLVGLLISTMIGLSGCSPAQNSSRPATASKPEDTELSYRLDFVLLKTSADGPKEEHRMTLTARSDQTASLREGVNKVAPPLDSSHPSGAMLQTGYVIKATPASRSKTLTVRFEMNEPVERGSHQMNMEGGVPLQVGQSVQNALVSATNVGSAQYELRVTITRLPE